MAIHEKCGIFGIYDPAGDCARTAYYGLYALQHQGHAAGEYHFEGVARLLFSGK